jgi:D-3-phosphoglycerate dehydrogenase / 2-oxoglutarate reductase
MKILLTTTSFQDAPGNHHDLLNAQNWEMSYLRGPLKKVEILDIIAEYDALICGDDELDREVLEKGRAGNLRYISKYGVGLDKIDLKAAKELNIPVTNCPGVNQNAVAEHVLGMLFSFFKNIHLAHTITSKGGWERPLGNELYGKRIGILGLGAIGKELAKRTPHLGLETIVFDVNLDKEFIEAHGLNVADTVEKLFESCDIVSLHLPLIDSTRGLVSRELLLKIAKKGLTLINTSRAGLVDEQDIIDALDSGALKGYLTDVLLTEPLESSCLLNGVENVLITPHIGSRTKETIQRQGSMAVNNLIQLMSV